MTEPEDGADGIRVASVPGHPATSDSATDPGRAHPYESLYRSPDNGVAPSHRVTRRDHEPSLSPPEGQSESSDPFGWLYREDTETAPRRALEESDEAESESEPVSAQPVTGPTSDGATDPASSAATTGEWTAIPVGHVDPASHESRAGRGLTALLVVLLVLAVLGVGLGIALALRSNEAARRQALVQPRAAVPSGVLTRPSQQNPIQETPAAASPAVSTPATGSTPSGSTTPPGATSAPYAGAVTAATPSGVTAQCHAAPATDGRGKPVRYDPGLMVDGDPSTAWRCNRRGKGEQVVFAFAGQTQIAQVGLVNGYTKVDPKTGQHRYPEYRRVTAVTWSFPDGKAFRQTLADGNEGAQTLRIPVQVTDRITLTIESTTKPGIKASTRDAVLVSEATFGSPSG